MGQKQGLYLSYPRFVGMILVSKVRPTHWNPDVSLLKACVPSDAEGLKEGKSFRRPRETVMQGVNAYRNEKFIVPCRLR